MTRDVFEFGRLQENPGSVFAAAVLYLTLVAAVAWMYRRDARRLAFGVRGALIVLRVGACTLLLIVYLDPQVRTETTVERPSRVAVLVDRSLSMAVADGNEGSGTDDATRADLVVKALKEGAFLRDLRRVHDVSVFAFGASLKAIGQAPRADGGADAAPEALLWDELAPRDEETRLGDALADVYREHRAAPLSAVVVFTDGQSNAGAAPEAAVRLAREAVAPMHAVGVGRGRLPANLRVGDVQAPARAFLGDLVTGRASLSSVGMAGVRVPIDVALEPRDGGAPPTLVESRDVELPSDDAVATIEFQFAPPAAGAWRIVVRAADVPGEATSDDNSVSTALEVVDQTTKVLLIAGGPTREYRFVRNLLYRDPSVQLSVHLQSSAGGAQEADELLHALPDRRDAMFAYDVLIAVDPDWSIVPDRVLEWVQEWVSQQAGGLIFIAGPVQTPRWARRENRPTLDVLFPVAFKEVFTSDFEAGRYVQPWPAVFTPEGEAAGYLRLDDDPGESRRLWEEFSGVYWCFPAVEVKPSATVFAHVGDPRLRTGGVATPLFAGHFYGAGRVFYLGTGEMWRLRQIGEKYYDRFWIRLVRELGQGRLLRGAARAALLVDADRFTVGSRAVVHVQVLGDDYQPLAAESVTLSVVDPAGKTADVELKAQGGRPGFFFNSIHLAKPGEYRLQLLPPGSTQALERCITAEIPQRELADPRLNRPLLSKIAGESGGRLFSLQDIAQIPPLLADRTESTSVSSSPRPLWDNVWTLLTLVGLVCAEWLIRKWMYLA